MRKCAMCGGELAGHFAKRYCGSQGLYGSCAYKAQALSIRAYRRRQNAKPKKVVVKKKESEESDWLDYTSY